MKHPKIVFTKDKYGDLSIKKIDKYILQDGDINLCLIIGNLLKQYAKTVTSVPQKYIDIFHPFSLPQPAPFGFQPYSLMNSGFLCSKTVRYLNPTVSSGTPSWEKGFALVCPTAAAKVRGFYIQVDGKDYYVDSCEADGTDIEWKAGYKYTYN